MVLPPPRKPLECDVRRNGDKAIVFLSGEIDEEARLDVLARDLVGAKSIIIDTYGLSRINSVC